MPVDSHTRSPTPFGSAFTCRGAALPPLLPSRSAMNIRAPHCGLDWSQRAGWPLCLVRCGIPTRSLVVAARGYGLPVRHYNARNGIRYLPRRCRCVY